MEKIEELYPNSDQRIKSLGSRIENIIDEYCAQGYESGRPVTVAEIVGVLELIKYGIMET